VVELQEYHRKFERSSLNPSIQFRARGDLLGWGTALHARRLRFRFPSNRDISWEVKAASAQGWSPCHFHVPIVYISWERQNTGTLRACPGVYELYCH